ncbi:hypothetical protein [Bathymodiolus japonicus methanotrophic gill symbiont]|uniref:hypothetical protein n=1 Tax=Bathymodiolus japonicus methanotrophic gill symbiont TaxID=113269 RepID=UPI001C8EEE49|nr:hypothetical protein [Bathymodiolus japonicus methanotrophic gill symbiont]
MLNFHIRKVTLQSGDTRYRTIITKSGKSIKTKTFRRKADAKTWGSRTVLDFQENEANRGLKIITSLRLRFPDFQRRY